MLGFGVVKAQSASYDLFVSSRNTSSVKKFNGQTGTFIGDFVPTGSGGLNQTQEVAFGNDGNLYVSGRGDTAILKYDGSTGAFLGNFTSGYKLDNPTKMTYGPDGKIYVSQWGAIQNKVARFDAVTGTFANEFTSVGVNEGSGHAWDASGNLYVACYGSHDVRKFDLSGTFVGVFTASGHLSGPVNLWFGQGGDLFVLDWTLGSVQRFDGQTGVFKSTFLSGLQNAEGFTFGPDGLLYICDWTANNIKRYDSTGQYLGVFTAQGNMDAPNSLVFHPTNTSSVEPGTTTHPYKFNINQNYPNPFNPSTTITYSVAQSSHVLLVVYDVLGKQLVTLVNAMEDAGVHAVSFSSTTTASSAVYFCRLSAEGEAVTQKMMLIK
jgi:streptogramin lyase